MEKAVKFSHIYHSKQDKIIPFEDIERIYNEYPELYQAQYRRYLYCPKCKTPQMVYCNFDPPYIRVYPNQMHSEKCDHFHPPLQKQKLEEVCENRENLKSLNHQLNYLLRSLIHENISSENQSEVLPMIKKSRKFGSITKQHTKRRYVPV
ncbi:MAG: hypothetical protein VB035_14925 [Candidatus Fimivivens sp.]|nr:hypothetical protein [Candidatus Fimivivens sp.]